MKTLFETIKSNVGIGKFAIAQDFINNCIKKWSQSAEITNDGDIVFTDICSRLVVNEEGKLCVSMGYNKQEEWPEQIKIKRLTEYTLINAFSNTVPEQLKDTSSVAGKNGYNEICVCVNKNSEKFPENLVKSIDARLFKTGALIIKSLNGIQTLEKAINGADFEGFNLYLNLELNKHASEDILHLENIKGLKCKNLLIGLELSISLPDIGPIDVDMHPVREFTEEEQKAIDKFVKANDIDTITFQSHSALFGYNVYWDNTDKKYKINMVDLSLKRRKKLK